MARPISMQDITAIDVAIHWRGCGHTSVELRILASPVFKKAVQMCLFNYLIAF